MLEERRYASNRSGAVLTVLSLPTAGERRAALEIERLLRPGMGFLVPHVHEGFTETFAVVQGVADAWIGRHRVRLGPGDRFEVPPLDVHTNPWNRSQRDLIVRQTFSPATRETRRYVEALAECLKKGCDRRGDLPAARALALLAQRRPETYIPGLSRSLQRRVIFPAAQWALRRRDERRMMAEEERRAARASQYGYWAEDGPLPPAGSAADAGGQEVAEAS
jgi:mannose-6-phosphate isomerase-like protein (cupin superfamily)